MRKMFAGLAASALGAFVGIKLGAALSALFGFATWAVILFAAFGALFGGLSAWAGADVPHFVEGFRRAWRETMAYATRSPNWKYAAQLFVDSLAVVSGVSCVCAFIAGIGAVLDVHSSYFFPMFDGQLIKYGLLISVAIYKYLVMLAAAIGLSGLFATKKPTGIDSDSVGAAVLANIFTGYLFGVVVGELLPILCSIVVGAILILAALIVIGKILEIAFEVGSRTYVYVHTYTRRCAFWGAVVGTLVGAVFHFSVFVGVPVGMAVFLLEHELVAKRILRVVPA